MCTVAIAVDYNVPTYFEAVLSLPNGYYMYKYTSANHYYHRDPGRILSQTPEQGGREYHQSPLALYVPL